MTNHAPALEESRPSPRLGPPLLAAASTLAALVPEAIGLSRRAPGPMLVPYRTRLAGSLALGAGGVGVVGEVGRALGGSPDAPRPTALRTAQVVAAASGVVWLGARAAARRHRRDHTRRTSWGPTTTAESPCGTARTLTVLAFNVRHGMADPTALAATIEREHPDLVVLPEAGDRFRARLLTELAAGPDPDTPTYRSWSVGPGRHPHAVAEARAEPDGECTSVLVGPRLGAVEVRPVSAGTGRGWVQVRGGALGSVRVLAVHTVAPVGRRDTDVWAREVAFLGYWLRGPGPTVVAGDLNATLEHQVLREALHGARSSETRAAERGAATWPAGLPHCAGVTIDHVLASPSVGALDHQVLDLAGSDHRAVLVRLRLPAAEVAAASPTTAQDTHRPEPVVAQGRR